MSTKKFWVLRKQCVAYHHKEKIDRTETNEMMFEEKELAEHRAKTEAADMPIKPRDGYAKTYKSWKFEIFKRTITDSSPTILWSKEFWNE